MTLRLRGPEIESSRIGSIRLNKISRAWAAAAGLAWMYDLEYTLDISRFLSECSTMGRVENMHGALEADRVCEYKEILFFAG
jgi:hypothetical protein